MNNSTVKILVMDDEEVVSMVAGEMLEYLGYDVSFATDGHQALAMYGDALSSGNPFGAVIMDLSIPNGMGGREAIGKIVEIDPHVRAIVSSGNSSDPVMVDFSQYGFAGAVAKPYKLEELGAQVSMALQK